MREQELRERRRKEGGEKEKPSAGEEEELQPLCYTDSELICDGEKQSTKHNHKSINQNSKS